jgi:sugar lactone lactonase YvrE
MSSLPEPIFHGADLLGELPLWDARDGRIWWVDVNRARLQSLDASTGHHQHHDLPGNYVGSWAMRRSGGAVVALDTGLHEFDAASGVGALLVPLIDAEQKQSHRPNDAKCDRRGRYWVGSLSWARNHDGKLYCVGPDHVRRDMLPGIAVPNGLCFSPDDTIMYFCDSERKAIWAFDFDIDEGRISNQRAFCDLTDQPGIPDGSTVDAEGFVWNAGFGASRIVRYDPKGRVDRIVPLPTRKVTSLAFGGADLGTLFITTASAKLSPEILAAEPLAGALFAFEPGPKGLPEPAFAG